MSWFDAAWRWYLANATAINPIGALVGIATAATLAWAGIKNARTAARRHEEQSKADRQRRITESFSKATEQLASEKIEARLGGIYTLERISRESPDDYWAVMETLTAFLREHTRWNERGKMQPRQSPATDIAAVLTVIVRRDHKSLYRERENGWTLDFRRSDLRDTKSLRSASRGGRPHGSAS